MCSRKAAGAGPLAHFRVKVIACKGTDYDSKGAIERIVGDLGAVCTAHPTCVAVAPGMPIPDIIYVNAFRFQCGASSSILVTGKKLRTLDLELSSPRAGYLSKQHQGDHPLCNCPAEPSWRRRRDSTGSKDRTGSAGASPSSCHQTCREAQVRENSLSLVNT